MKIERTWLRIIVSVIVGGIAGYALYWAGWLLFLQPASLYSLSVARLFAFVGFLAPPVIATVLAHVLTPKKRLDGYTRCGKCGYILKGLTEPRCSECGERI